MSTPFHPAEGDRHPIHQSISPPPPPPPASTVRVEIVGITPADDPFHHNIPRPPSIAAPSTEIPDLNPNPSSTRPAPRFGPDTISPPTAAIPPSTAAGPSRPQHGATIHHPATVSSSSSHRRPPPAASAAHASRAKVFQQHQQHPLIDSSTPSSPTQAQGRQQSLYINTAAPDDSSFSSSAASTSVFSPSTPSSSDIRSGVRRRLSNPDSHHHHQPNTHSHHQLSQTAGAGPSTTRPRKRTSLDQPTPTTATTLRPPPSPRRAASDDPSSNPLAWLTGSFLSLPPAESKKNKSDDEREADDAVGLQSDHPLAARRHHHYHHHHHHTHKQHKKQQPTHARWGMAPSQHDASPAFDRAQSPPAISMTPPPPTASNAEYTYPQSTNVTPPRQYAQAFTSSPLMPSLCPLPVDPNNVLPLSLPPSPFPSPPPSHHATPFHTPHPSFPDMQAELQSSSGGGGGPSSSSPRTSISTSSSRWLTGRSDSRSSAESDEPASPSAHAKGGRTWWFRANGASALPISPKLPSGPSLIPRPPRAGFATSCNKFVPTGMRSWGWLICMFGGARAHSRGGMDNRERERLMGTSASRRRGKGQGKLRPADEWGQKWLGRLWAFVPTQPWTIAGFLAFLAIFAVTLTLTIKHILNPDKTPLPWRSYCTESYPTLYALQDPTVPTRSTHRDDPFLAHPSAANPSPINSFAPSTNPANLVLTPLNASHSAWPYHPHPEPPFKAETVEMSDLEPVGVLLGVFTTDAGAERRHMIRQSYASHWRSRRAGTEGVRIRFVMGRPRKRFEKAIQLEMEAFNDILLLDIPENMNSGKTHAFFTWAAENATVPHWEYPRLSPRQQSAFTVAQDGGGVSEIGEGSTAPVWRGERRPDYVVKADEDSFIMLGELERRLRVAPRTKTYWGYLVKNLFMAGECYALSFDLVQYIAASPALKSMTRGKEDKLVSRWIGMHPERESIVWVTDRCWIYDHPKAGTVYSHGFLFPSAVGEVRSENTTGLTPLQLTQRGGASTADAYSTVSEFGVAYRPLSEDMTALEQVEALIEGSPLSRLREERQQAARLGNARKQQPYSKPVSRAEALGRQVKERFSKRPSRRDRFLGDERERGGTVVVHYIKRQDWFVETMVALLGTREEGDEWGWFKGRGWAVESGGAGEEAAGVEVEALGSEGRRVMGEGVKMSKDAGL